MSNQTLVNRNNFEGSRYVTGYPSLVCSDFRMVKGTTTLSGERRISYISPRSVTVMGDGEPRFYRKCFAPRQTKILSAAHTENDRTLILSDGKLYRYYTQKTDNTTDIPDNTVDVEAFFQGGTPKEMTVFPAALGGRVITIATTKGLLLLHFQEANWVLLDQVFINTANGLLYGGDDVAWSRGSNVEGSRKGKLLIGSLSSKGGYFETLLELDTMSILGSWDEISLLNKRPGTGEILYDTDGYSGIPSAPKLKAVLVTSSGASLLLNWTQERPDVVSFYEIEMSQDNGMWNFIERIPSGAIRSYEYRGYTATSDYRFRVRACNQEGKGPWSNEGNLIKSGKVCQLGSPQGPGAFLKPGPASLVQRETTAQTKRATYPMVAFNVSGTTSWSTVIDPSVTGGSYVTFVGDGNTQKVNGEINFQDYGMICVGHKVSADSLGFTFKLDNWTLNVPPGASQPPGWTETLLGEFLIPPGAYTFSIEFPNTTKGLVGALSHLSIIPILPMDLFRGERWFKPNHPCVFLKGKWDTVLPPVPEESLEANLEKNFPQNVTTITGKMAVSSDSSSVVVGISLANPATMLLHGRNGERDIQVKYNGKWLKTVTNDYRSPARIDIPSGMGVLELYAKPEA